MNINDIVNYLNLYSVSDNSKFTTDDNNLKKYGATLTAAFSEIKDNTSLTTQNERLKFATNNLQTYANTLNNIETSYKNPVTGAVEDTNITIDSIQQNNLKNSISNFVEEYNASLEKSNNLNKTEISNNLKIKDVTTNLTAIGITVDDNGELNFDESKFDEKIKAGATKVSDIKNVLSDISTLTNKTETAAYNIDKKLKETNETLKTTVDDIKLNFSKEQQEIIAQSLNNIFYNDTTANFLSSIGIGKNINNLI